jgi:hypothetical protein
MKAHALAPAAQAAMSTKKEEADSRWWGEVQNLRRYPRKERVGLIMDNCRAQYRNGEVYGMAADSAAETAGLAIEPTYGVPYDGKFCADGICGGTKNGVKTAANTKDSQRDRKGMITDYHYVAEFAREYHKVGEQREPCSADAVDWFEIIKLDEHTINREGSVEKYRKRVKHDMSFRAFWPSSSYEHGGLSGRDRLCCCSKCDFVQSPWHCLTPNICGKQTNWYIPLTASDSGPEVTARATANKTM